MNSHIFSVYTCFLSQHFPSFCKQITIQLLSLVLSEQPSSTGWLLVGITVEVGIERGLIEEHVVVAFQSGSGKASHI